MGKFAGNYYRVNEQFKKVYEKIEELVDKVNGEGIGNLVDTQIVYASAYNGYLNKFSLVTGINYFDFGALYGKYESSNLCLIKFLDEDENVISQKLVYPNENRVYIDFEAGEKIVKLLETENIGFTFHPDTKFYFYSTYDDWEADIFALGAEGVYKSFGSGSYLRNNLLLKFKNELEFPLSMQAFLSPYMFEISEIDLNKETGEIGYVILKSNVKLTNSSNFATYLNDNKSLDKWCYAVYHQIYKNSRSYNSSRIQSSYNSWWETNANTTSYNANLPVIFSHTGASGVSRFVFDPFTLPNDSNTYYGIFTDDYTGITATAYSDDEGYLYIRSESGTSKLMTDVNELKNH